MARTATKNSDSNLVRPDVKAIKNFLTGKSAEDLVVCGLVAAAVVNSARIEKVHAEGDWLLTQGDVNGMTIAFFGLGIGLGFFERDQPT